MDVHLGPDLVGVVVHTQEQGRDPDGLALVLDGPLLRSLGRVVVPPLVDRRLEPVAVVPRPKVGAAGDDGGVDGGALGVVVDVNEVRLGRSQGRYGNGGGHALDGRRPDTLNANGFRRLPGSADASQASDVEADLAVADRGGLGVMGGHDDDRPAVGLDAQQLQDASRFVWSSSEVGSSARRTGARAARPRATATRCCCPPDSSSTRWSPDSASPTSARAAEVRAATSDGAAPVASNGQGDVLGRGEHAGQAVALRDERDPRADGRPAVGDAGVSRRDVARHRRDGPGDCPEQRRLSRTGRTREREEGAGRDDEVDRVDCHQLPYRTVTPRATTEPGSTAGLFPVEVYPSARALGYTSTGASWDSGASSDGVGRAYGFSSVMLGTFTRDEGPPVAVAMDPNQGAGWQVVEDVVRKGQRPIGGHDRIPRRGGPRRRRGRRGS